MENILEKVNKAVLFFIIYSFIVITFFKTLGYTLPFVLAICFALMLKGPTKYLIKKFKFSESLASLTTTAIFFLVVLTLLFFMITSLASDITQLTKVISTYAVSWTNDFYILSDKLQSYFDNLDPYIVDNIKNSFTASISTITKTTANIGMLVVTAILKFASSVPYILMVIIFTLMATYFFTKDISKSSNNILGSVSSKDSERIIEIYIQAKKMLLGYVKSYASLVLITFMATFIGFLILKVRYALVLSILSALFDALPVLGMAIIYIPVAIVLFINGEIVRGIFILVLYATVMIVRQITEPKLVSSNLGLHPVSVIAAIFIGLQVNGVAGMFFCMFLVVFYTIFKKVNLL